MARGVNKVILLGNVGRDPESRQMANGDLVCNFSLATNRSWTDKQTGEKREKTEWHRLVAIGALAEIVNNFVKKGSQIYVDGEIQTREWEKDGVKRYTTEIRVWNLELLDSIGDKSQKPAPKKPEADIYDNFDDDIDF